MKSVVAALFALVILASPYQAAAAPITINFDSLEDLTTVGTEFEGLTFLNATVLTSGISLNEFEFPPHSGANVVLDDGGAISISFATPVFSFGGFFTYLAPLTLTAFDTSNNTLGSVGSLFSSNLALSGEMGSSPNELLQFFSRVAIGSVLIAGDPVGGSFVLDDLTYDATRVPEPGSLALLVIKGAGAFSGANVVGNALLWITSLAGVVSSV